MIQIPITFIVDYSIENEYNRGWQSHLKYGTTIGEVADKKESHTFVSRTYNAIPEKDSVIFFVDHDISDNELCAHIDQIEWHFDKFGQLTELTIRCYAPQMPREYYK